MSTDPLTQILVRLQAIEDRLALMEAAESRRHPPMTYGWHRVDPCPPVIQPVYEHSTDPAMLGINRGE